MEIKKFKKPLWFFAIFIVFLIIFLPGYTKLQELRDRSRYIDEKMVQMDDENIAIQRKLELIQNNPVYQERVVREKMGVVRKGEVLYRIDPEELE
jgi:cell division protein FtsB